VRRYRGYGGFLSSGAGFVPSFDVRTTSKTFPQSMRALASFEAGLLCDGSQVTIPKFFARATIAAWASAGSTFGLA
jgi:hypothetical protein